MIGKAKSISHGINALRYITGESKNKKHPELIYHIKDNLFPCRLDAQGVWDMIKAHAPTGKNMIRIEISPAKGYMHTPVELCDLDDVNAAIDLLYNIITSSELIE